jgi:hypothetical protein
MLTHCSLRAKTCITLVPIPVAEMHLLSPRSISLQKAIRRELSQRRFPFWTLSVGLEGRENSCEMLFPPTKLSWKVGEGMYRWEHLSHPFPLRIPYGLAMFTHSESPIWGKFPLGSVFQFFYKDITFLSWFLQLSRVSAVPYKELNFCYKEMEEQGHCINYDKNISLKLIHHDFRFFWSNSWFYDANARMKMVTAWQA